MSLLPFFEWCQGAVVGETIRSSLWLFPVIEAFHLVAFAVLGGTVLLGDLRLLGIVLRATPSSRLVRQLEPWQVGSLAVAGVSGVLLFLSESMKLYYNDPFWVKMTCLVLAVPFTFTVRRWVARADEARVSPLWGRLVGVISIALWSGVAWGGRWIGFWG